MKTLLLALLFFAGGLPAAGDAQQEGQLTALRVTDTAAVLQTLKEIGVSPGFPLSAEPLLPALVWLGDSENLDVAIAAKDLARAIGWPQHYCLPCLRKFAARQDQTYKLMGLSALVQVVWYDPEAMWTLLDICENSKGMTAQHARRVSMSLSQRSCPDRMTMDLFNTKAGALMGRFQTSISRSTYRSRYLLKALALCPDLLPELRTSAKAAYEKLPPNSNANEIQ